MVTKQELILEAKAWKGINKYLFKKANKLLRMKKYDGAVKEISKVKTVNELRIEARALGIKNYWNLKEEVLIKKILEKQ